MMDDRIGIGDGAVANLVRGGMLAESIMTQGVFHVECIGADGRVKWRDTALNVVTTQGKNSILDKYLDHSTALAAVVMGLHTTVGNAASTYSTPSPQVESVVYSEANRPSPLWSAASAGVKSTSAAVAFSINGSATITGCFIAAGAAGVATKSDTGTASAILFSSGTFGGGSRAVVNGDTLNVTYSLTLT